MNDAPRELRLDLAGVGAASVVVSVPREATVLAFDFGTRRIGVAVGNTLVRIARPLATIDAPANDARFAAIAALIDEWQPDQLVVGVPVHDDGSEHAMTLRARRPVVEADERHTTHAAVSVLESEARGGRASRGKRDEVAASVILQAWFDERDAC